VHKVEQEFDQWEVAQVSVLTVGTPTGGVVRLNDGGHQRTYNFEGTIKPLDVPIDLEWRTLINIEIVAVRCYATDDPGGTDEAYLIATLFALDPLRKENAVNTIKLGPQDCSSGDVFWQGHRVDDDGFFVAGDGGARIHVAIWDEEAGPPETIQEDYAEIAKKAIRVGLASLIFVPKIGPALAAGALAVAEATDATNAVGNQLGEWAADMLADDLIDQQSFVLTPEFLLRLKNGQVPDRTSDSIPGLTYNFPENPEDDSWIFSRGSGQGSYRVFFRIRTQAKSL
jgi:hypothetical protein